MSLSSIKALHCQAMESADQADVCRLNNDTDGERQSLRLALHAEEAAIAALSADAHFDRAVLTESADAIRQQLGD